MPTSRIPLPTSTVLALLPQCPHCDQEMVAVPAAPDRVICPCCGFLRMAEPDPVTEVE